MEDQAQQSTVAVGEVQAAPGMSPFLMDVVIYTVVALVVCCFCVFVNSSPMVRNAGFFAKFFAIVVGTGLGAVGALVGNALRKAVQPDAIWTSGGFGSLLWNKVFWKWGPQTIGMVVCVLVGIAIVLK